MLRLTDDQIIASYLFREFKRGDKYASYKIACNFMHGTYGFPINYQQAIIYFLRAAISNQDSCVPVMLARLPENERKKTQEHIDAIRDDIKLLSQEYLLKIINTKKYPNDIADFDFLDKAHRSGMLADEKLLQVLLEKIEIQYGVSDFEIQTVNHAKLTLTDDDPNIDPELADNIRLAKSALKWSHSLIRYSDTSLLFSLKERKAIEPVVDLLRLPCPMNLRDSIKSLYQLPGMVWNEERINFSKFRHLVKIIKKNNLPGAGNCGEISQCIAYFCRRNKENILRDQTITIDRFRLEDFDHGAVRIGNISGNSAVVIDGLLDTFFLASFENMRANFVLNPRNASNNLSLINPETNPVVVLESFKINNDDNNYIKQVGLSRLGLLENAIINLSKKLFSNEVLQQTKEKIDLLNETSRVRLERKINKSLSQCIDTILNLAEEGGLQTEVEDSLISIIIIDAIKWFDSYDKYEKDLLDQLLQHFLIEYNVRILKILIVQLKNHKMFNHLDKLYSCACNYQNNGNNILEIAYIRTDKDYVNLLMESLPVSYLEYLSKSVKDVTLKEMVETVCAHRTKTEADKFIEKLTATNKLIEKLIEKSIAANNHKEISYNFNNSMIFHFKPNSKINMSNLLLNFSLWNNLEKCMLIEDRHKNPDIQNRYDKRFGLISLNNK